ncbi:DMT family transporter [Sporosarcina sp. 179-K 3D1 HS]|uniref:DMT family transporter n=1 Tax=Sporosarcina sp. 179-K 3D1 HS TaxID=3232169 RepID=UPI0039A35FC3
MNKVPPFVLLVFATILWGGNFVIGRGISSELPPFTLSFLRWCTAFLLFLPIAWVPLKRDWRQMKEHWPTVVFMSITGVASFNTLIYVALHYTTSINASLMNTSTPIIIYILSFFFLKEKLTRNQLIGTFISLLGVLFIISKGSFESLLQFSFNQGDLIVIIAVICWAVYSLLVKQYSMRLPGSPTFLVSIFLGMIMLLPFFLYETANPDIVITWSLHSIAAILYTGIFASIVAFVCWNTGVIRLGANKAGIYLNFIPVFATVFAVLFIGESLQLFQVIGGLFVILGVFLTTREPQPRTSDG